MSAPIKVKTINSETVKAIPPPKGLDLRPVRGSNLIPECYANIFLCAKKKSGKTSVIFKLLKGCVGKNTTIIAFVSTLHKDQNWIAMKKYFEEQGIPFVGYTSLMEDGEDHLANLVMSLQRPEVEEEEEEKEIPQKKLLFRTDDDEEEKEKKKKPLKYLSPEYILVFDDLSDELKSKSLVTLLKKNRHMLLKVIISSQYLNDLLPESRKQIDTWLLFKSQPTEKLEQIYMDGDLTVPFPTFQKMYKYATQLPYSFFYVDVRAEEYRIGLSKRFVLEDLK
jgi:hypothetical protein